jgi:hypothetical protein
VVKLTRSESFDPNEFAIEWLKSRSGLAGKHILKRDPLNYGWHYAGPVGGSLEELNQVVNVVNMRKTERFTKQQVASLSGSFDSLIQRARCWKWLGGKGLLPVAFKMVPMRRN